MYFNNKIITAKYVILALYFLLHISEGQENNKLIKLDNSNYEKRCNDYLDRLVIRIAYNNKHNTSTKGDLDKKLLLKYRSNEMQDLANLQIIPSDTELEVKTIIDAYYSYQLHITDLSNNATICHFDFIQFGHCDLAMISLNANNQSECSIKVKSFKEFTLVPYIYMAIGILLGITVTTKFLKMFFVKYRHI